MTEKDFCCQYFGVKSIDYVSKAMLAKALTTLAKRHDTLVSMLNYVRAELYCENPNNAAFSGHSPESLKPLAKLRALRQLKAARPWSKAA